MARKLSKLERVELREYWDDEARAFTPWLAEEENLRLLSDAIGIELEFERTEARVGSFKADIVARIAGTQDRVIIENQLERTNHDHLGKLLTYASGFDAKLVIWVCSEITDEHRKALDWLNDITGEDIAFFGLEIELWRIGESDLAPKFNVVCRPNEWARTLVQAGADREPTETKLAQLEFWRSLVEYGRQKSTALNLRKPRPQHWYTMAIGRSGFELSLTIDTRKTRMGCELYLATPRAKAAFAKLATQKGEIEAEVGAALEWQELPLKQASRIAQYREADLSRRDQWTGMHAWLLERAEVFSRVFGKRVRDLSLNEADATDALGEAG